MGIFVGLQNATDKYRPTITNGRGVSNHEDAHQARNKMKNIVIPITVLLISGLLLINSSLLSAGTLTLKGKITDSKTGEPIRGAVVFISIHIFILTYNLYIIVSQNKKKVNPVRSRLK